MLVPFSPKSHMTIHALEGGEESLIKDPPSSSPSSPEEVEHVISGDTHRESQTIQLKLKPSPHRSTPAQLASAAPAVEISCSYGVPAV